MHDASAGSRAVRMYPDGRAGPDERKFEKETAEINARIKEKENKLVSYYNYWRWGLDTCCCYTSWSGFQVTGSLWWAYEMLLEGLNAFSSGLNAFSSGRKFIECPVLKWLEVIE